MTEFQPARTPDSGHGTEGEIDLRQLAHVLWHYRISLLLLVILGAAAGATASALSMRFRSQGLFLTPGLNVENYKPFEAAMANEARMRGFLSLTGDTTTPAGLFLLDLFNRPNGIQEATRPAFAFTDRDAKQFGVKSDESAIVGISIVLEEPKASEQNPPFALLGEYVRDTKIKLDMERITDAACLEQTRRDKELRNSQIKDDFQIRQHESMAETLRGLLKQFPESGRQENQVVSLEKGAEKFLSPTAQLVAVEVAIADLHLAENLRARDRISNGLMRDYYCAASSALHEPILGRGFLKHLESIQNRVFSERDARDDAVEATANELELQRASWNNEYLYGMRFVTSPTGSQSRVYKLRLGPGIVIGAVLGGLLGVLLALGRYWWRRNRDVVLAAD